MAQLTLSLLGTFQVTIADKPITTFRSVNVQGLLVYLALEADRTHSREVLATLFWSDEPDEVAKQNLRQSLYQLRQVFGDYALSYLHITRQTAQFNRDSAYYLDVQQFLEAVEQGNLNAAASLYTGDLLPGFTCPSLEFEEWLRRKRERLHQSALKMLFEWTEQQIAESQFAAAQATARRQLNLEPWHEPAHRQLLQTLFLNGERNAALAHFDVCKAVLLEELGAEPDAQTVALVEQIRAGEEMTPLTRLLLGQPHELAPRHNLPARLTPYFGRSEEQTHLLERITDPAYRLITLVGEGGIGKSRLAQELAWQVRVRFADGVWYVPLAGLSAGSDEIQAQAEVATTIAQTLGLTLSGQKSPQAQLLALLRERQVLLILDNFEHLLAGADIVPELLRHAPQVVVICTSREPLNYQAEWVYYLEPLPLPPLPPTDWPAAEPVMMPDLNEVAAVQLFVDRAQRAARHFAFTPENQLEVLRLCWLVAGNPLGLELAAASLQQQPLAQIIYNLESSLDVLATHYRDIPPRHRTMRAVFVSSWELLTPAEQPLFASLAVFRGGFTAAAAQAITGVTPDQLETLRQKSLIHTGADERYEMHELLRQFAAEKLAQRQETDQVAAAHSHHYLEFAAAQRDALVGETPYRAARRIAADLDNLRQAWQTALKEERFAALLAPVGALAKFYEMRGLYREAAHRFGDAAAQLQPHAITERLGTVLVHLLTHQTGAWLRLSEYDEANVVMATAYPLAEQVHDQWAQSKLSIYQGELCWRQSQFAAANQALNRALTIAQAIPSPSLTASATFHLGVVCDYQGQPDRALRCFRDALTLWQALGNRRQAGYTLNSYGAAAFRLNQMDEADTAWAEALAISRENGDLQGQSMTLNNLSLLATERHEYDVAQSYLLQAFKIAELSGDQHASALFMYNAGENAYQAGWFEAAQAYLGKALPLRRQVGDKRGEGMVLKLLGDMARQRGRVPDAISSYQSALALSQEIGNENIATEVQQVLSELLGERA
jgi:predicted ATPase/DNA-binding SARP family transcriptional activator